MGSSRNRAIGLALLVIAAAAAWAPVASAQYFGRNKVQYETFQFQVLSTDHFNIYFYPSEEEAAKDMGRMAERWYSRYRRLFAHTFEVKKPIVLYANHADFEQTNVLSGFVSEGTGGVTESLKNRVVLPLTGDYAANDHVLGHELVHVFQYDIANAADDTTGFRIDALPLWLIEGMAEYISLGRDDSNTAMWMRDALYFDDFPTIKQLTTDPKYFPYRYGEALWAFVGGTWGDRTVPKIYNASGRRGMEYALAKYIGMRSDSLSKVWKQAIKASYEPAMAGRSAPDSSGRKVLAPDMDSGKVNLAPSVSPDGRRVAFLSEKDLFSIDLFLADAETGKIIRRLVSSDSNPHFDSMRFIDSAGSWSPDGKQFVFVVFAKGNNDLAIVNAETGDFVKRIRVPAVGDISNPSWSPDGKTIAFAGSSGGISDLYLMDVATEKTRRLTNDRNADLSPTWSPDGKTIAWVTDRSPRTDFENLTAGPMRLGLIDVATGDIRTLAPFGNFKHMNPEFAPDGKSLYFISDRGGFSDVYRIVLATGEVYQVTNVVTGVSGITGLSPAMSVARESGRVMFSVFIKGNYNVYSLEGEAAQGVPLGTAPVPPSPIVASAAGADTAAGAAQPGALPAAPPAPADDPAGPPPEAGETHRGHRAHGGDGDRDERRRDGAAWARADSARAAAESAAVDTLMAAFQPPLPDSLIEAPWNLPPERPRARSVITAYLADPYTGLPSGADFKIHPYHPKLQLDFIGATGVGVAVDRYGAGLGGGVSGYFSDMLGNHVLAGALAANGGVKDVGGQIVYQNRTHRWNWGVLAGHIPYLSYYTTVASRGDTFEVAQTRDRTFVDSGALLGIYPFSSTRRVEATLGYTHLGFDREVESERSVGGLVVDHRTVSGAAPSGLSLAEASVALVGDNSFFGFTSPIKGGRFRLEVDPTLGTLNFQTLLVDYRRYFFLNPVTFAARAIHVGRYGRDAETDRLNPLFVGYASLVRGYSTGSFDLTECGNDPNCPAFNRLIGSRIGVANLEVRVPVLGTSQFGLINFPYVPTELAAFLDGGVAWTREDHPVLKLEKQSFDRVPVFSTGLSARINVLGALVMEIYYAYPFQRPEKGAHFGFQIAPGW